MLARRRKLLEWGARKSPFDLRDGLRRKGRIASRLSLTCCCWPLHRWVERGTVTVFVKFFTHVLFQLYALNIHQKVSMMFSMSGCRCYKRWLCCKAKLKHVRLIAGSTDGSEAAVDHPRRSNDYQIPEKKLRPTFNLCISRDPGIINKSGLMEAASDFLSKFLWWNWCGNILHHNLTTITRFIT